MQLYFVISGRSESASLDQSLWQALTKILLISGTLAWKTKPSSKSRYCIFSPKETVLLSEEKVPHAATVPFLFYAFGHSQLFRSHVASTGIFDVLHLVVGATGKSSTVHLLEERYVLGVIHRLMMFHLLLGCWKA